MGNFQNEMWHELVFGILVKYPLDNVAVPVIVEVSKNSFRTI